MPEAASAQNLRTVERFILRPPVDALFGNVPVAITDLSLKGARFTHKLPLEAGAKSVLQFSLDQSPLIPIESAIVWTQNESNGAQLYVSGVRTYGRPDQIEHLLQVLQEQHRSSRIEEFRAIDRFRILEPMSGQFSPVGEVTFADISARGARISALAQPVVGSSGTLRFRVPKSTFDISVTATVVWSTVRAIGMNNESQFSAGLRISEKPELMRGAIGHMCELNLATLDTSSLKLKLKIILARASKHSAEYQAIEASGLPPDQFFLIESVREELRSNPQEAIHWHQKARAGATDDSVRRAAGPIADHREAMAVWEYLDRTIDPTIIARSFAWKGYSIAEAQEEIFRLHTLVEASKLINSSLTADTLFESILRVARKNLDVERGTLYFVDAGKNEIWSKIASGLDSSEIRLPIGKGLAGTVAETGEMIVIQDAYDDPRFDRSSDTRSGFETRSVLCAPIKNRDGRIVGVLQLLNKRSGKFGTKDVDFLESLSDHMAIAMENATLHLAEMKKNRMERELQLGREIQSSLLPKPPSDVKGTEIAAESHSCYEVGGDYYDFIELPTGEVGFAIGDVSGKGVSAALVMSSLQASLRMAVPLESDLPRLMSRLNGLLYRMTSGRKYVTFFFGRYDPRTGMMTYVNAGHNPPHLCQDGELISLGSTGRPIGLFPEAEYEESSIELRPGSTLFLYTDGLTEASNNEDEEYGNERWAELVASHAASPVEGIPGQLLRAIKTFEQGAPPCDDKTVVVLHRKRA
ncbi:MAG TPA: SpoIIE family protein phosphatase [Thermoanaerobaculia bacterium]|nr:SpoIIE family protein phosphatase [Thermoanaerobaculia bacterium]